MKNIIKSFYQFNEKLNSDIINIVETTYKGKKVFMIKISLPHHLYKYHYS